MKNEYAVTATFENILLLSRPAKVRVGFLTTPAVTSLYSAKRTLKEKKTNCLRA
jgi:hypothetical protein